MIRSALEPLANEREGLIGEVEEDESAGVLIGARVTAIEERRPRADRQRRPVHRRRHLVAKSPARPGPHERVERACWQALDAATDPRDAERRLRRLVTTPERDSPSAAAGLAADPPARCAHLSDCPRLPQRFRSSALPERSLEDARRRTKAIGRFPGETSCLRLGWAVLALFSGGARGLGLTALESRRSLRRALARAERDDFAKIA